ncbi:CPBP family glutamic-type intramembrane protease [Mesorhizobium sp. M1399]|uniref:CPBP family glutamic-type intramembrane protease n=1 Tax=Mesorhizobium sp. M1399 TaxID=2957096 RepID=UPI003334C11C
MLFARSAFAVAAQGLVAAIYAAHGSATPWRDAGAWLPAYGSLIDAGCLGLLWWLARARGHHAARFYQLRSQTLGARSVVGRRAHPPGLVFIYGGIIASSLLVYGNPDALQIYGPLPLLPALYGVLIFPLVWGITEQTTYNGYLLPRFQVLSGSTGFAVAVVAFSWSFQHAVMPLTFDPHFMLYRLLAPIAHSTFITLVYLRVRRILPLATAHWLMDGVSAFIGILWPLLR